MNNIEILKQTNLGDSVAENEQEELKNYFIKTEAWEMLNKGSIDIIYGGKGTGKSALYLLLTQQDKKLQEKGIYIIAGEEISGDPVFAFLNDRSEAPLDENKFRDLWKLYILTLIGNHIRIQQPERKEFNKILSILKNEGLIPIDGLQGIFKTVWNRIAKSKHSISVPDGPTYTIVLGEPTVDEEKAGKISIRTILKQIDEILTKSNIEIWILFDRLDAAFSKREVETPALRALFRVYRDFAGFKKIKLKIFLRDDIWERITHDQGFTEQSHITRTYHIRWINDSLRHLILSRFFNNPAIEDYTKLKRDTLGNSVIQDAAFYSIFPDQVESGPKKSKTFDWILKRVQDGKQNSAPREIIDLIKFARQHQVHLGEVGGVGSNPVGYLISPNALELALHDVSKRKVETLWSEYPALRRYIELFRGGKTEYSIDSVGRLFTLQQLNDVANITRKLIDIGFFQEKRGSQTSYWIPFIFRPYLRLTQVAAFVKTNNDVNEDEM